MSELPPADLELLAILRKRLPAGDLPGAAAQQTMAPRFRGNYAGAPPTARNASVLALLYPIDNRLHLLYIQRTSPANDRHAGQISFPGGSAEAEDATATITALREAEEEVGIPREKVEIFGALTPLYVPVSNFLVAPFVGFSAERPTLIPQASEVARTLELPFADFLTQEARQVGERKLTNGMTLKDTPYWAVQGEEIWGATAMMTAELVALVAGGH